MLLTVPKNYYVNAGLVLVLFAYLPLYILKFVFGYAYDESLISQLLKFFLTPGLLILALINQGVIATLNKKIVMWGIFFLFVAIYTREFSALNLFLTVLVLRDVKIITFYKVIFFISSIFIFFILFSFVFNYINDEAMFLWDGRYGVRFTFGYGHPNAFPIKLFMVVVLFVLIKKDLSMLNCVLILLLTCFVYVFTYSRTFLVMTILLIFLVKSNQYIHYFKLYLICFLSKWCFLLFLVATVLLVSCFNKDNDMMLLIDRLLSNRVESSYILFSMFDIKAFGSNISTFLMDNNLAIDNLYIYLLYKQGWFFMVVLALFYSKLVNLLNNNGLYNESICFILICAYSLSERQFFDISNNILLFLFSFLIFHKTLDNYKKDKL